MREGSATGLQPIAAGITRLQKLRASMETLIANRDSFMTSSEPYFVLGVVPCPGTGKVATPRARAQLIRLLLRHLWLIVLIAERTTLVA